MSTTTQKKDAALIGGRMAANYACLPSHNSAGESVDPGAGAAEGTNLASDTNGRAHDDEHTPPHTPTKPKQQQRPQQQKAGKRPRSSDGDGDGGVGVGVGVGVGGVSSSSSTTATTTAAPPITPKRPKTSNKTSNKTPSAPSRLIDWKEAPSRRTSTRVAINATKQTVDDVKAMMRAKQEPGIASVEMEDMKGFGVVAQKQFAKGDYVCEYSGDLISMVEAKEREHGYILEDAKNGVFEPMCYMYYLTCGGKKWCVDATKSGRIGRLINHSRVKPNLQTKLVVVDNMPRLGFYTLQDIGVGTEMLYDYGERDPAAMAAHPWLKDC